jgi:uncharacterized membrane protein
MHLSQKHLLYLSLTLIVVGITWSYTHPPFSPPGSLDNPDTPYVENSDSLMIGRVSEVLSREEKTYEYDGDGDGQDDTAVTTKFIARIKNGDDAGTYAPITLTQTQKEEESMLVSVGDTIVVGKTTPPDAPTSYYFYDFYRLHAVLILGCLFFIATVIFAGYRGFTSILGLMSTMGILFFFVVPSILSGQPPLLICGISSIFIGTISVLLAHGKNRRTIIAVISTIFLIILTILFAYISGWFLTLTGLGTEEAFYLQAVPNTHIDVKGLLLGGILLGVLGVLDDITTAQAAIVEELHRADRTFSFGELYRRATSVGKEHITSLVNTLILAYTGASFPLLLLFFVYPQPWWTTLNNSIVMEEIARTFVGSMTLVLAVPITTLLAAYSYTKNPLTEAEWADDHHHTHGHHH